MVGDHVGNLLMVEAEESLVLDDGASGRRVLLSDDGGGTITLGGVVGVLALGRLVRVMG